MMNWSTQGCRSTVCDQIPKACLEFETMLQAIMEFLVRPVILCIAFRVQHAAGPTPSWCKAFLRYQHKLAWANLM